jgi:hypothetical protein
MLSNNDLSASFAYRLKMTHLAMDVDSEKGGAKK